MNICCICLTETDNTISGCNHICHDECIENWYLKSNSVSCPMCRKSHPDGINKLKELWCKTAYEQLLFIKCCLLYTYTPNVDIKVYLRQFQWYSYKKEPIFDSINRFVIMAKNSITWILNTIIKNTRRMTRHDSNVLEKGISLLRTRLNYLYLLRDLDNTRIFYITCQYFECWGYTKNYWKRVPHDVGIV